VGKKVRRKGTDEKLVPWCQGKTNDPSQPVVIGLNHDIDTQYNNNNRRRLTDYTTALNAGCNYTEMYVGGPGVPTAPIGVPIAEIFYVGYGKLASSYD